MILNTRCVCVFVKRLMTWHDDDDGMLLNFLSTNLLLLLLFYSTDIYPCTAGSGFLVSISNGYIITKERKILSIKNQQAEATEKNVCRMISNSRPYIYHDDDDKYNVRAHVFIGIEFYFIFLV